jgi:hypothetical protein
MEEGHPHYSRCARPARYLRLESAQLPKPTRYPHPARDRFSNPHPRAYSEITVVDSAIGYWLASREKTPVAPYRVFRSFT